MAFTSGHRARCFFNTLDLSAYTNAMSTSTSTDMHDVTVFTDSAKKMIPGLDGGTFTASGPFDVDAGSIVANHGAAELEAAGSPSVVSFFPAGVSAGGAVLISSNLTQFDVSNTATGPVEWTISAQTTGQVDSAGTLLNSATITADTNGSSVDNGAATTNGAVFHLHTTAFSGFTSDVIIVQGSTTGAFAGEQTTIATFATQTAALFAFGAADDRQEVTGTVPRYLRVVDDVTGSGSITRHVVISRR